MRGLAAELRELRIKAGLNTREAAKRIGISPSSLNRMELGNRMITPEDTAGLLVAYGVTGKERDRLLMLSREADLPGWWETHSQVISKQLRALIKFESEATRITEVTMLRIPGLMQTHDYTYALMTAAGVTDEIAKLRIAVRLDRQKVLTRDRNAPRYLAIIDECALIRPIGNWQTMANQLRHLIVAARHPNIDIRVVPLDRGAHTGLDGSYTALEFAKARPLVLLEHKRGSGFLDEKEDVGPFRQATATLLETALNSPESVKFLARKVADYQKS